MEISAHFSDIQTNISEEIKKAKYNIFVAVAWITDKSLWTILEKKAEEGVIVQVILVPDEINRNNNTDFIGFLKYGGQLYWDYHHHKFCVIDVKTVITGSYNWTYMANNRGKRENIIVLKQNTEIAEQFSDEFKILLRQSEKYQLPKEKEIVYVDKEIEKEVLKIVEKEVVLVVEKEIEIKVKEDINKFTTYDKGGKSRCGKCHSNKLIEDPKAPKTIQNKVKFYCKACNTYYDNNGISI
jgi:phosphatidylserine/phosphatidylglycerophosphate/cardiolipin synthase-like enzyme